MAKIVYNNCFGGFSVSKLVIERMIELGSAEAKEILDKSKLYTAYSQEVFYTDEKIKRHDPLLVQAIEELGNKANGQCSKLCIFKTDADAYRIKDYDGQETVKEKYFDSDGWILLK